MLGESIPEMYGCHDPDGSCPRNKSGRISGGEPAAPGGLADSRYGRGLISAKSRLRVATAKVRHSLNLNPLLLLFITGITGIPLQRRQFGRVSAKV
jgi:hypothetical protein